MSSNNLNVNLPLDVADQMNSWLKENNWSKKELVSQALRQYLAIKTEEKNFRAEHPDSRVSTRVTFKAKKGSKQDSLASVMIY